MNIGARWSRGRAALASHVVLLALVAAAPARAQQLPDGGPPSITVGGEASANVAPDTAIVTLGVVTDRPRPADALAENSRSTQAVIDAAKAQGIAPQAIQTTSVTLSPVFEEPSHGTPKVTGFRAANAVEIRIKPVEAAGPLIGKLADKGVNAIDDLSFSSAPDPALQDRLRQDAMRDAKHKAEVYVEALGLKLGRVLAVSPAGSSPPMMHRAKGLRAAAAPVPLEAGQQSAQESVSVTWELVQ